MASYHCFVEAEVGLGRETRRLLTARRGRGSQNGCCTERYLVVGDFVCAIERFGRVLVCCNGDDVGNGTW